MIAKDKQRRIEALINGEWVPCDMGHLEAGDVFRMFEADGSAVIDLNGRTQWTVEEQAAIKVKDEPNIVRRTLTINPLGRTHRGLSEEDKARLDAITDADIEAAVASDPDAVPLMTAADFVTMEIRQFKE